MHDQINGCHIHKEKKVEGTREKRIMTGNKAKANTTAFSRYTKNTHEYAGRTYSHKMAYCKKDTMYYIVAGLFR